MKCVKFKSYFTNKYSIFPYFLFFFIFFIIDQVVYHFCMFMFVFMFMFFFSTMFCMFIKYMANGISGIQGPFYGGT
jgi:hypothetical protein